MKTLLSVLTVAVLATLLLAASLAGPSSTASGPLSGVKICLDPGHGGSDPGAVNDAYNLNERDINLDVSRALRTLLLEDGAEVVLTRTEDEYLTNEDRYTFCNDERATILVSVHTNSVTDSSWDGSMALYAPQVNAAEGETLARAIHAEMYPFLRDTAPDGVDFRDFGFDHFASGVLFKSDMPAAMMEPLFMSNTFEAPLLVRTIDDPDCQDLSCRRGQIVQALHLGILNYFNGSEPPPPVGTMHVAGIEMSYQTRGSKFTISTVVTVHDASGQPVSGATVSLSTDLPKASKILDVGRTDEAGNATFTLRSGLSGTYHSTVTDVSKEGWLYDQTPNVTTKAKLIVP